MRATRPADGHVSDVESSENQIYKGGRDEDPVEPEGLSFFTSLPSCCIVHGLLMTTLLLVHITDLIILISV